MNLVYYVCFIFQIHLLFFIDDTPDLAIDEPSKSSNTNSEEGGRASLMAAIRNAGGSSKAGLKSIKERKMEEKKAKQEVEETSVGNGSGANTSGGGDLMSDLASKLAMRRKGISGANQGQGQTGFSTMDKISMMIPSLADEPNDDEDDDENSSEDDWN